MLILKKDSRDHRLGKNKRTLVVYRKAEKVVLRFLKDCANKVAKLAKLSKEDALKEINQWKDMQDSQNYFKETLCSLL